MTIRLDSDLGISATGNITTDNYFIGNGSQLTGIAASYGNANVTTLLSGGTFTGNIIPAGNATQSLGNATNQWKDLWVSNATIYINSIPLGVGNTGVLQFDGNDIVTSGPNVINTGNVETSGDVIGGNLVIATGGLTFADGSVQTSAYGNANVEAYLPSSNTIISINSNIANTNSNVANLSLEVANLATSSSLANTNANVANLTTDLGNTNSNVTNLSNALGNTNGNVANLVTITTNTDSNVANLTTDLANTNSNVSNLTSTVSDQGNAIANLQGSTYSNANASGFLAAFGSNTISTTGNITVGDVTLNNLYSPNYFANAIAFANATGYVTTSSLFKYNPGTEVLTVGAISTTGNITGNYIIGNGSLLSNITGANVTGEVAVANTVSNPTQSNITALGTITSLTANGIQVNGQFTANGNAQFNDNVYFAGNVSLAGNITQISGNSGQFFGNTVTGFDALYAGLPSGYTLLPQEVINFTTNYDGYSQVLARNINTGSQSTTDFVATSDNGTDVANFVDLGVAGSGYNGAVANNSLGTSVFPNDSYLYAQGNTNGGNLILGSNQANGVVRIIANGQSNIANVVATFSSSGIKLPDTITIGPDSGNSYLTLDRFGITANTQMVLAAANASSGNNSSVLFDKNGGGITLQLETNVGPSQALWRFYSGNLTFPDGSSQTTAYGNANVAAYLPTYTGNLTAGNLFAGANGAVLNDGATTTFTGGWNGANGYIGGISMQAIGDITIEAANQLTVSAGNTAYFTVTSGNGVSLESNLVATNGNYNITGFDTVSANIISATGNITARSGTAFTEISPAYIQLGNEQGATPYIDFNSSTALGDYDSRIIASGGSNIGVPGQGNLEIIASTLTITGANLLATGNISATGNITGDYALFNDIQLNDLSANAILYTDANRNVWNTDFSYDSTNNTMSGGNISVTGNVTAGYFIGDGSLLTGLPAGYSDANVVTLLSAFGSNTISTSGNVSTGNIVTGTGTGGNITGVNIMSANVFIGDGGNLTNLPSSGLVVDSMTSGANITASVNDTQYNVTALAVSANVTAPTGVAQDGQKLTYRIVDNGTPQALSWDPIYQVIGVTLPTTTVASKYVYVGVIYNDQDTTWDVVSVAQQA
jgi:hypothetical protein